MTAFAPDVVIFNSQLSDASDRMLGRGHDANDRTRNIPRLLSKSNMPEAISQYRSEAVEGTIANATPDDFQKQQQLKAALPGKRLKSNAWPGAYLCFIPTPP
jgi:hypothetical protein